MSGWNDHRGAGRALAAGVAATALLAGVPALAQTAPVPAAVAPNPAPSPVKRAAPPPKAAKPKAKPASDDEDNDDDEGDKSSQVSELVVRGTKPPPQRGAVVGDIKPELQLGPADIQSYGVSTVTELLSELSPETRSDRGRGASSPVVLLNGHRISGLNEVQNIPTEAIERIDILPEEVSLKYGYTANQRVVNIVLKRRFRAITGEAGGGTTTEGGDAGAHAEADRFEVRRENRLNLDLKYQASAGLSYADRSLTAPTGGAPFDLTGNVVSATPGAEIDPGLSALAGRPVTIAGVPASAANGEPLTLADFAPTAGTANVTDSSADRSLAPATQSLTANAVYARPIFWGINATVNATLGATTSRSMQGLAGISLGVPAGDPFSPFASGVLVDRYVAGAKPLEQAANGWTLHLGSTLNRDKGDWRVSLTDAFDHGDSETETGVGLDASALQGMLNQDSATRDPFGPLPGDLLRPLAENSARAITNSGNIQLLANGPLLKLPAGDFYASVKAGDAESMESSASERRGTAQNLSLSRNTSNAQLNLDVPLANASHHVLGFLGELSANVNAAADYLSDFGFLPTLGYGLNWTPVPGYNLIVSETHDHAAPTLAQLDGPVIETPGAPVFDYQTGQTVDVSSISGGNGALKADSRRVIKVGLTIKPLPDRDLTLSANYIDSRIDNPIETFPAASAAIEAAFPDRFIRDAEGQLIEEDLSPVNFARQDHVELRWGVNFSTPVGKQPPPRTFDRSAFRRRRGAGADRPPPQGGSDGGTPPPDGAAEGEPPGGAGPGGPAGPDNSAPPSGDDGRQRGGGGGFGAGGGRGGRGGGGRGGFGGGLNGPAVGGRFQIAFYHTVIFKDQFLVRPGGPVLDLLGGSPAGGAGGQYQHEIEAQMGYTNGGYGARLSADWRSATTVMGGAAGSAGELNFSDIATVNLRLWDDFSGQRKLVMRHPILRGVRVTFAVTNLFNQSIRVTDSAGATPLIYQSNYLDPTGRVISLSLRKLFY